MPVKIVLSLAIIGYLVYRAVDTPDKRTAFFAMLQQHKDWGMLATGFVALLLAVVITMVRWWYLVRAVGIDFPLPSALRISFLGYMVNFAPTGIAGGDMLKAWMVAKEHPGNTAKSLASVVVDRIIGLYVLFLVATAGIFISGLWQNPDPKVHWICIAVFIITAVSTAGIALILIPGFLEWLDAIFAAVQRAAPKIGHAFRSLLEAIKVYRGRRAVLFWTSVTTIPVHTFLTISVYMLALGLGFQKVPFLNYFGVYPISSILATIPLPAGPQETGIVYLYKTADVAQGVLQETAQQEGLILALLYRLSTILIVPIGAAYYFLGARGEVSEVMHQHEEDDEPAPVDLSG